MAYDKGLAQRVREILEEEHGFNEKKMFGGICILFNGNMAFGILKDDIIVRVGPDIYLESLKQAHVREFDITGRPMKGWVMVSYEGYESDKDLIEWVYKGVEYARSLPPK
jgi:TfoX/Sxy family transcriptional regulator of competence genes